MKKVIIYGAGGHALDALRFCETANYSVVAFADKNEALWGKTIGGLRVIQPSDINTHDFDSIFIGTATYCDEILAYLEKLKFPREYIDDTYARRLLSDSSCLGVINMKNIRVKWLQQYAHVLEEQNIVNGAVAEVGVFQGEFSSEINRCFPTRNIYLFDLFGTNQMKQVDADDLYNHVDHSATSIEIVRDTLPYPEMAVFKQGYFPDTACDVDANFIFVNLDCNIYEPTVKGLEFFWPRMIPGGAILVHDYNCQSHQVMDDIRRAVNEFSIAYKVPYFPNGDGWSIGFFKSDLSSLCPKGMMEA